MSLLKIARIGHPVIRSESRPVPPKAIKSPPIQRLIEDMVETMRDADGVGIAAPQVHVPKRIIVIEVQPSNPRYPDRDAVPLTILVNPEITAREETTEPGWEGCLSVPELYGEVPRWTGVTVAGRDPQGRALTLTAKGFFARVLQHEVDHLDGKVYLDRLPDMGTLSFLREFQKYGPGRPA